MSTTLFEIAPDAEAWIINKLRGDKSDPMVADLVPGLFMALGYELVDEQGQRIEAYPHTFYDIGWYRTEIVQKHGGVEFELLDLKLFVFPDGLAQLVGRKLILEEVRVGAKPLMTNTRTILKAIPKDQ